MKEKLFSVEIEITMDLEDSISFLENLNKFAKSHGINIFGKSYLFSELYEKAGIPYDHSLLGYSSNIEREKRIIVVDEEEGVGPLKKDRGTIDIFEIRFQKFDLGEKEILIYSELANLLRTKGKNYGEFEGIHINLDVNVFFPYVREIILRNENFFDYNERYREKKELPDVIELFNGFPVKDLKTFCNLNLFGRTELRIFNSNDQGYKKSVNFLNNVLDIWKEGYNNYSLSCIYEEKLSDSILEYNVKTTNYEKKENVITYKDFEDLKNNYNGCLFETKTLFSAVFDEYEKIF